MIPLNRPSVRILLDIFAILIAVALILTTVTALNTQLTTAAEQDATNTKLASFEPLAVVDPCNPDGILLVSLQDPNAGYDECTLREEAVDSPAKAAAPPEPLDCIPRALLADITDGPFDEIPICPPAIEEEFLRLEGPEHPLDCIPRALLADITDGPFDEIPICPPAIELDEVWF
jgi:hypothetical protein